VVDVYRVGLHRPVDQGQIQTKRRGRREGDTSRNVRTRLVGQQGETQNNDHSEDIVCGDYCCPRACYTLLGRWAQEASSRHSAQTYTAI